MTQQAAKFYQGIFEDDRGTRHGLVVAWLDDGRIPSLETAIEQARAWLEHNPDARLVGLMEVDASGFVVLSDEEMP